MSSQDSQNGREQAAVDTFWAAIADVDRAAADAAVARLGDILPVVPAIYSFPEEVSGDEEAEGFAGETGRATTPRSLDPGTPQDAVTAWNQDKVVTLRIVSRKLICGARIGDGEKDFQACGVAPDLTGKTCGKATHEEGGKDSKGRPVRKMELPEDEGEVLAINVRLSSVNVKAKVFSRPSLPLSKFPNRLEGPRNDLLLGLQYKARSWKVLLDNFRVPSATPSPHPEPTRGLSPEGNMEGRGRKGPPAMLNISSPIPSPRLGAGGYNPNEFAERPDEGMREPTHTGSLFQARGQGQEDASLFSLPSRFDATSTEQRAPGILLRLGKLEARARQVDANLAAAFGDLREELDGIWASKASQSDLPSPSDAYFHGRASSDPVHDGLTPTQYQRLLRELAKDLAQQDFVTHTALRDELLASKRASTSSVGVADISGLSMRISKCETELFKPEGSLPKALERMKRLEDGGTGKAVERGNKIFRDINSTGALVALAPTIKLHKYVVDAFSLFVLAGSAYENVADGVAREAAAYKAQYDSLMEATIALSYGMQYPDNMVTTSAKKEHESTGGYTWATSWASYKTFKGSFGNGARDRMNTALKKLHRMILAAINYTFKFTDQPEMNAILTEQLRMATDQAEGIIKALEPLYDTLEASGMDSGDAWSRTFVFIKALFDDIHDPRCVMMERNSAGMIWGSFRATQVLHGPQGVKSSCTDSSPARGVEVGESLGGGEDRCEDCIGPQHYDWQHEEGYQGIEGEGRN